MPTRQAFARHAWNAARSRRVRAALGEGLGTFILVFGGLSCVFALMASSSPIHIWLSLPPWIGRSMAGFSFAAVVTATAASPLNRWSLAHYNPSVTWAHLLLGRMSAIDASVYIIAQMIGSVAGAVALRLWGHIVVEMQGGRTVPGPEVSTVGLVLTEGCVTWAVVTTALALQAGRLPRWLQYLAFPLLFAGLTAVTGPLTGTSSNLARTIGPALVGEQLQWVAAYGIATLLGASMAARSSNRS